MTPDARFAKLPKSFWAHVRSLSESLGYTERGTGKVRIPTIAEMVASLKSNGLKTSHLMDGGNPTDLAKQLLAYFTYRADALNNYVKPLLMNADDAAKVYEELLNEYEPKLAAPMNKQKGDKKQIAFLTAMINLLVEKHCQNFPCDFDPRGLTTVTQDGFPLRTLARRVDGCFPSKVDPIALWEVKEYYYTTTFGSRVADGVYETLLDGMELEELLENEDRHVEHLLMVDSRFTWWDCGRSYLCRMIDMLHMGYVDEILFGKEVVEKLPISVARWVQKAKDAGIKPTGTPQPELLPTEDNSADL
jgi:hypothetical protein